MVMVTFMTMMMVKKIMMIVLVEKESAVMIGLSWQY